MIEQRIKRSHKREEALQFLVESVADRSEVDALVLLDDAGRILAGVGMPHDVQSLKRTGRSVACGTATASDVDLTTGGRDMTTRPVATRNGTMYFAALGDRLRAVGEAVRAVQRIVA
jgi:hypothetical protein